MDDFPHQRCLSLFLDTQHHCASIPSAARCENQLLISACLLTYCTLDGRREEAHQDLEKAYVESLPALVLAAIVADQFENFH